MKLRASTIDRIEQAFAEAVASGDYDAADGWLTTARYVTERADPKRRVAGTRRRSGRVRVLDAPQ